MVCFTCQKCNECLKKSAVAKHAMFSRKCLPFWLTCIDCLKDFRGDEHLQHTSCVTEDVRYGAKGVQAKAQGVKQNMWMDSVTKVINAKHNDKNVIFVFNSLRDMTNVPKIRKKFHNFMKSKLGRRYDHGQSDVAFTMLEAEFEKAKAEKTPQNDKNDKNIDETSNDEIKKKKKKHKNSESHIEQNDESNQNDENTDQLTKKEHKKKKKQEKHLEEITSENLEVQQPIENENLSKKELKKRKKQEKYLAELNEIENYQKDDIQEEPAKIKKSKRKHEESEEIPTETKSKKRKVDKNKDLSTENPNVEYAEPDSSTVEDPQTFKWDQVILDILKHRSDNELSFKRLSKKVMAEYCERFGDDQNFEYLMKKFNKKIKSTKGVVVCKDKVMLKIDEI